MSTIEQVAGFLHVKSKHLVKTLIFRTDQGFLAALVRGDHEVNPAKLRRLAKTSVLELATSEEIQKATGGPIGFSGPVGLKIPIFADFAIEGVTNGVSGGNQRDLHLRNVNANRDFRVESFADIRMAVEGDGCPRCGPSVQFTTGIEVGHVFKLGTKYSAKMNCQFSDQKGQLNPMVMGCYGIGVNRIVASAIENHHDANGILWPKELAPYQVELITVNPKGDLRLDELSRDLYEKLVATGMEVLWDDRDLSPGVKFSDADLIGLPLRIILGKKTVESGTADVKTRNNPEQKTVPLAGVVEAVQHAWTEYRV
jgi:prolyl-tRNA synthetase